MIPLIPIQNKKVSFIVFPIVDKNMASKRYSHPGPGKQQVCPIKLQERTEVFNQVVLRYRDYLGSSEWTHYFMMSIKIWGTKKTVGGRCKSARKTWKDKTLLTFMEKGYYEPNKPCPCRSRERTVGRLSFVKASKESSMLTLSFSSLRFILKFYLQSCMKINVLLQGTKFMVIYYNHSRKLIHSCVLHGNYFTGRESLFLLLLIHLYFSTMANM